MVLSTKKVIGVSKWKTGFIHFWQISLLVQVELTLHALKAPAMKEFGFEIGWCQKLIIIKEKVRRFRPGVLTYNPKI